MLIGAYLYKSFRTQVILDKLYRAKSRLGLLALKLKVGELDESSIGASRDITHTQNAYLLSFKF